MAKKNNEFDLNLKMLCDEADPQGIRVTIIADKWRKKREEQCGADLSIFVATLGMNLSALIQGSASIGGENQAKKLPHTLLQVEEVKQGFRTKITTIIKSTLKPQTKKLKSSRPRFSTQCAKIPSTGST